MWLSVNYYYVLCDCSGGVANSLSSAAYCMMRQCVCLSVTLCRGESLSAFVLKPVF